MGMLRDGMLQGLRYDPATKKWTTKTWELKKNPRLKTAAEEAKSPIIDGDGLELRLLPGGSMVWRVAYSFQKTRKSYTAGRYTGQEDGVSLAEAREALIQVKKWIKEGIDPSEQKKAQSEPTQAPEVITFEKIAREWLEHKTNNLTTKYRSQVQSRVENYLIPAIGQIPIADLRGRDILPCLREHEARGHIETAHRLAGIVSQICRYAVVLGHCEFDAAGQLGSALSTRDPKNRAAILDPTEIGTLLRAIDSYKGDISTRYALKIVPYVFLRNTELRCARWEEIDLDNALWTIPAERMKKKREHLVPLATQVIDLFRLLKEISKGCGDLVFPSPQSKTQSISDVGLLNGLRRLGYGRDEMCIHGFRAMASTLLNEQGFRSDVIEMQLAHVQENQVRAAYNRALYLDERRDMMQKYADYLDKLKNNVTQTS